MLYHKGFLDGSARQVERILWDVLMTYLRILFRPSFGGNEGNHDKRLPGSLMPRPKPEKVVSLIAT
jgi:hypothetical protein